MSLKTTASFVVKGRKPSELSDEKCTSPPTTFVFQPRASVSDAKYLLGKHEWSWKKHWNKGKGSKVELRLVKVTKR
jgi:hypothetical protein